MTISKILGMTATVGAMAVMAAQPALAQSTRAEATGVGGGALIGALAGGPVGLIIGAAVGGHYGATRDQAGRVPTLDAALAGSEQAVREERQRIERLKRELDRHGGEVARLGAELSTLEAEREALLALRLDLLYTTDSTELTAGGAPQVAALAAALHEMPNMIVVLEGHADRRGAAEYNEALAMARATGVRDALVAGGISSDRIVVRSHGERLASAPGGNPDADALDRRVSVSLARGPLAPRPAVASNR